MKTARGQSLYEMVAAIGVIGIALFALVSLATLSLRNANFSKSNQVAISLSQEAVEWLRSQRDDNWQTFRANANTGVWCLQTLAFNNSGSCGISETVSGSAIPFRREAQFSINNNGTPAETDDDIITATVITSWDSPQGASDARVTTDFTGWR